MNRIALIILLLAISLGIYAQSGTRTFFDDIEFVIEPQGFNTVSSDISPFFINGKLYYSSVRDEYFNRQSRERKNKAFYDIYEVSLDEKGVVNSGRELVPGFGSEYHEGPAAWCKATEELFVTLSNVIDPDTIQKFIPQEQIRLRLAIKKMNQGSWEIVEELPFNNDKYHFAHPAVSVTGDTLVFSSDMENPGTNNSDLYMSVRTAGRWSDPAKLGPHINTTGNEMFPVFGPDGLLLFSSDNQAGGYGQLDIYYTTFPEKGPVLNLGNKINSRFDDFGLVIHPNREVGYFASERPGMGSDDIYRIDFISSVYLLAGRVLDDASNQPVEGSLVQLLDCNRNMLASRNTTVSGNFEFEIMKGGCYFVEASKEGYEGDFKNATGISYVELRLKRQTGYQLVVMDLATHLPIEGAEVYCSNEMKWLTNSSGVSYPLFKKNEPCTLRISKDGYLDQTLAVDPSGFAVKHSLDTIWLFKPELHKIYTLKNIYYDFDKWFIREDARPPLDNLVGIMKQYPIHIELSSHTDSRGTKEYNQILSQRRAESAIEYLTGNGISPSRLNARGYGESMLVNHCADDIPCSEALHQANRRTEFMITALQDDDRSVPVNMGKDTILVGTTKIYSEGQQKSGGQTGIALRDNLAGSETYFTVQILASVTHIPSGSNEFLGEKLVFEKRINSYYKYYLGKFDNYESAIMQQDLLKTKFPGCFIVAFKEGSVVSTKELQEYLK